MTQPDASAPPEDLPRSGNPGTPGTRDPKDRGAQDSPATPADWAARATEAARSVTRVFGQRLFFLPGTHIGAIFPPLGPLQQPDRSVALLVAGPLRGLPRGCRPP